MATSFSHLLRTRSLGSSFHLPLFKHPERVGSPSNKSRIFSHHFLCYHFGLSQHHVSLWSFQQPSTFPSVGLLNSAACVILLKKQIRSAGSLDYTLQWFSPHPEESSWKLLSSLPLSGKKQNQTQEKAHPEKYFISHRAGGRKCRPAWDAEASTRPR